ncbi:MAG: LamG-like jellyroll fold domain-containing protein [Bacteroidota bacterium]
MKKPRLLKRLFLELALVFLATGLPAQQIEIPRIATMPDFPQPYEMRDWKQVAQGYDSLVFDEILQGQFQPFVFFRDPAVNYPGTKSFGLHTAVGTNHPTSGEAINVIPAVVGASLAGIDKSDQFDENWVLMIRDYFNKRPEENIYLNHPSTSSGYDWWYETMPNVFYMQLMSLYPEVEVFQQQLPIVAGQWLRAVKEMGGSATPWSVPYMNYRAWNMPEMEPLDQGVKQPEAAGAIAWILYHAWVASGNRDYLVGAEWAMEFLDGWQDNPSYELQLPWGVYTAARMNAELGTNYDIEKMINWTFDRGNLRGWGAISGNWGGYDCHGLIGEANDNGNDYAFMMNGYQQAAALVPMVRYDHRFAQAIAKWVLNVANASRLFYSKYLPAHMQDNADWAQTWDPQSYIGYEALREVKYDHSPYMTGDAMDGGWAQTNLMLYGSSHVGYLAAVLDTTNVEGILQLDLLKTDFFRGEAFPTYLYYNPHSNAQNIHLYLPEGEYKIYDVISKQLLQQNMQGMVILNIGANKALMPVVLPQSAQITYQGRQTLANDIVIDYRNGLPPGNLPPRIKALAATDTIVVTGESTTIFCTATDPQQSTLTYSWYASESAADGGETFIFEAPAQTGFYTVACKVTNTFGLTDSMAVVVEVVEKIPYDPVIEAMLAEPRKVRPGEASQITTEAYDVYDETLTYSWSAAAGSIAGEGATIVYTAPPQEGDYFVHCMVSNPDGLWAKDSILLMVRNFPEYADGNRVGWYPLRGNVQDFSGNQLHGTAGGGLSYTTDMEDRPGFAAFFDGTSANVLLPASELFDFRQAVSVSLFLKTDEITPHEQHPISHGSWEHRYKISITGNRIRFTINTADGIKDLDSETTIEPGSWYHVAAIYNGNDMELWIDGKLDAFAAHTGLINISPYQPVMGQNLPGNNNFNFKGAMSMVSIFDFPLSPLQVADQLSVFAEDITVLENDDLQVIPNPVSLSKGTIRIKARMPLTGSVYFEFYDMRGIRVYAGKTESGSELEISPSAFMDTGIYLLGIRTENWDASGLIIITP